MDNKIFYKFTKRFLFTALILASANRIIAAEKEPWKELNLSSTRIEGATVYYEKFLEQKLPFFKDRYKQFLAERENFEKIGSKKKDIINDINKILGITDPDIEKQNKNLTGLLETFSFENTTFYIVSQDTTKSFLASGGKLPNFTYNKSDNTVTYNPEFIAADDNEPVKHFEFAFLVASGETFEKNISLIFRMLQKAMGGDRLGFAVRETVESGLLNRVRPTDPYWRWFSDGFSNVITIEILKKHAGSEVANEFAKAYYISPYKVLEKEINLRYWMGLNFCIKTPLEYENELQMARSAYATQEVQRLIELHGIDSVSKIVDKILTKKDRTSEHIFKAVNEVTGENMQQRFDHYQTFESRQDGLAKHGKLFSLALENKDYNEMLVNLLRTLELQESPLSPTGLQCYKQIAILLFKMGHEQAGDQAMQNCVELFKSTGTPAAHQAAMEAFMIYAFSCKNAKKALEVADELLKNQPDHILALTVRMVAYAEAKRLSEAKQIAQKVIELDKNEQSPSYRTAIQVLSRNEQQDSRKKP
ncbi:MAG: hypothetical protein JW837_07770 [Sedimentisphaerales bacterium]|nr:hypothetical protein [Sedimentisphaerales bacterium]